MKAKGIAAEGVWWGGFASCLTACCLFESNQTSDYDINANLNVSQ